MRDPDAEIWGTVDKIDLSQSILFSNDEKIVRREVRVVFGVSIASLPA